MDKNRWTVGEAKQRFSEIIRLSEREPQLIYRRDTLVAAVVSVEREEDVSNVRPPSLAERFEEARALLRSESYRLTIPARRSRKNAFLEVHDAVARRHKRPE